MVATSGICVASLGIRLPPLRDKARLKLVEPPGHLCDSSRKMFTAWPSPIEGCWVPSVHADCNHNEIAALLMRSLGPTPCSAESARGPVHAVFRKLRMVSRRYGGSRWSHLETAQSYTGALRRRYLEAESSLRLDGPVSSGDVMIRGFLKAEKVNGLVKFPKPRMIFPRSPRYNLDLASWLKPFEHWLWGNLTGKRLFGGPPTRVVAKGLNPRQRANLIVRKMRDLGDCVVVEVDGKAFEAHCDVWQLEAEHAVYLAAYGGDRELANLLRWQLHNFGVTKGGVKFARHGGRASGDFNTGMGNSLIMLAVVVAVLRGLCRYKFDILVDGDNALVFLSRREHVEVVKCFAPLALKLSGHEMTLERPVECVEGVRFGQSAPVWTRAGWTMVRDYVKVLSNGTSNHAHLREPRFRARYLRGVALCELSLNVGVPILGRWAELLRRATWSARAVDASFYRDYQYLGVDLGELGKARFEEPTYEARLSFMRAFGVTPDEQLFLERSMSLPSFENEVLNMGPPLKGMWFDLPPGAVESFLGGGLIRGE